MQPNMLKADRVRPEYHRCMVLRTADGKLHAISTGSNQTSSRLLNTQAANGFAIIPADVHGVYKCTGLTTVILIGDVEIATEQGISDFTAKHAYSIDEAKSHPECKCGEKKEKAESISKSKFSVVCVTISDRASKGEYPEDLSGKAM
jgi:hypothetical protein